MQNRTESLHENISQRNSQAPSQQILSTSTMNYPKISLQRPDENKSTSIKTEQTQSHSPQQWWEDFRNGLSSRRNSNVSPVQQQSLSDFKHDVYLHSILMSKCDSYGFASTGPSREPTPTVENCWEDFKHSITMNAGGRLEKNPFGFTSELPSRAHTPDLTLSSSGQASRQQD
jgi:hypothetical protein